MRLDVKFADDSQDFTAELSGESQLFPAKFGAVQPATIGIPGASAYEIAVKQGFEGTEEEWLASLEGEPGYTPVKGVDYFDGKDGKDGVDGQDGYSPVRGTDYWTESDRQEIIDDVLDEVLNEIPEAPKQAATFYTELSRYRGDSEKMVCVNCHGLTAGEKYGIHLYTSARRRGTSQDPWRHPSNENTGEGYTGKGYANLVGLKYGNDARLAYPDAPSWMPRGGILQTEWTFTAKKTTEKFEINIGAWLVPLLKPILADFNLDEYALIGVSTKAIAPLLFQFRLVKDGTVGDCRNTLCVGLSKEKHGDVWVPGTIRHVSAKKPPEINTSYLYTSIR